MPSFDTVSEINHHEVSNAVDQAVREIEQRFDLRGTGASVTLEKTVIHLVATADFQLKQVREIVEAKLIKRGIDISCLEEGKVEGAGKELRQTLTVKEGIDQEHAKKIVALIKEEDEGAGVDPGRQGARHRQATRRPAGSHRAHQGRENRHPAAVQQLPRLNQAGGGPSADVQPETPSVVRWRCFVTGHGMHQRQQEFHLLARAAQQGFQARNALVLVADHPVELSTVSSWKASRLSSSAMRRQQLGNFRHGLYLPLSPIDWSMPAATAPPRARYARLPRRAVKP
jgi:uncharacterized protein YajQ (UPF0234 family)